MSISKIWVPIVVALLTGCRGDTAQKRLPLGFQGMRGKKNIDFASIDENFLPQNDPDKMSYPSAASFTELSRFNNPWMNNPWFLARLQNMYADQNQSPYEKRAPMGFMGMRGKKENPMDTGPFYADTMDDMSVPEYMEKRGMKGFQGMRGKKEYEYLKNSYFNKRRSMGFQGMRGKKDNIGEEPFNYYGEFTDPRFYTDSRQNGNDDFDGGMVKRSLKELMVMRSNEFDDLNSAGQGKRAPFGFVGMRGKKAYIDQQSSGLDDSKESPLKSSLQADNSFGMQEVTSSVILPTANLNEIASLDNFGVSDLGRYNDMVGAKERRSPNYGFYGVRGKKMPSMSSFYGMRGKKGPFDYSFRGKFVGVRGKKSDNLQNLAERLSWSSAEDYQKRRGPSGFVGMRGKKSIKPADEMVTIKDAKK